MKTFNYTFNAGETKQYPSGKFFILITAGDDVNVTYKRNNGEIDESAVGVQSGYYVELDDGFDLVEVYSATAQTVKIAISKSGSGGFNISSTVLTGGVIDTIKNVTPVTLTTHARSVSYVGTTLQTIVTPASNINGIRIDNLGFILLNIAGVANIISKSSAPINYSDANANILATCNVTGTYAGMVDKINTPIILPVGVGLYMMANIDNVATAHIDYEIL